MKELAVGSGTQQNQVKMVKNRSITQITHSHTHARITYTRAPGEHHKDTGHSSCSYARVYLKPVATTRAGRIHCAHFIFIFYLILKTILFIYS